MNKNSSLAVISVLARLNASHRDKYENTMTLHCNQCIMMQLSSKAHFVYA